MEREVAAINFVAGLKMTEQNKYLIKMIFGMDIKILKEEEDALEYQVNGEFRRAECKKGSINILDKNKKELDKILIEVEK